MFYLKTGRFCKTGYNKSKSKESQKYLSVSKVLNCLDKSGLCTWKYTLAMTKMEQVINERIKSNEELNSEEFKKISELSWKESEKYTKDAMLKGTEIHSIIKAINDGKEVKIPEGYGEYIRKYRKFVNDTNYKPLSLSPIPILSQKYKYSGIIDSMGIINNKLYLMDFKTGKAIYPTMALQLAAYSNAFEENYGLKVDECCCLLLSEAEESYQLFRAQDTDKCFKAFEGLLNYLKISNQELLMKL